MQHHHSDDRTTFSSEHVSYTRREPFINTEASQALSHTCFNIQPKTKTHIWCLSAFHKSHDFVSCSDPFTLKSRIFNAQRGKQFVCAITCSTFQTHEACKHYDNSSQSRNYCLTLSDASMNRPIHLHTRRERETGPGETKRSQLAADEGKHSRAGGEHGAQRGEACRVNENKLTDIQLCVCLSQRYRAGGQTTTGPSTVEAER